MAFTSSLVREHYIHALESTRFLMTSPDYSRAQGYTARLAHLVVCPRANILGFLPRWPSDAMAGVLSQAFALEMTSEWRRMS